MKTLNPGPSGGFPPEEIERLAQEARQILDFTSLESWTSFFEPLREAAVAAARDLLTQEDILALYRSQAVLAYVRRHVAELRRPFLELARLDPGHPLAGVRLPFADEFESAVDLAMGRPAPRSEETTPRQDRGSTRGFDPLAGAPEETQEMVLEAAEGPDACAASKRGKPKADHPWRRPYLKRR